MANPITPAPTMRVSVSKLSVAENVTAESSMICKAVSERQAQQRDISNIPSLKINLPISLKQFLLQENVQQLIVGIRKQALHYIDHLGIGPDQHPSIIRLYTF